ncbi:hypothetical protein B0H14DRAFT_3659263 [Mycena olivaceomarginata]|nr:hypothetical protein B0H14DRAFT_3659263 [Mycena olivaceomarginata]
MPRTLTDPETWWIVCSRHSGMARTARKAPERRKYRVPGRGSRAGIIEKEEKSSEEREGEKKTEAGTKDIVKVESRWIEEGAPTTGVRDLREYVPAFVGAELRAFSVLGPNGHSALDSVRNLYVWPKPVGEASPRRKECDVGICESVFGELGGDTRARMRKHRWCRGGRKETADGVIPSTLANLFSVRATIFKGPTRDTIHEL